MKKLLISLACLVLSAVLLAGEVLTSTTSSPNVTVPNNLTVGGNGVVTGTTTLTGSLAADGGLTVDTTNFTVNGSTGAVHSAAGFDGTTVSATTSVTSPSIVGGTGGKASNKVELTATDVLVPAAGQIDCDGNASFADSAGKDFTSGNTTGSFTVTTDDCEFAVQQATDNVWQITSGGGAFLDLDLGTTDTFTISNLADVLIGNNATSKVEIGAGTATADVNIANGATTQNVNIGNAAGVKTTVVGSTQTTSTTTVQGGSGGILVYGAAGTPVTVGKSDQTATVKLGESSATVQVDVATGTGAHTTNIANGAGANVIGIGGAASTVAITSTGFNVTTAGAVSGVTTLSASGAAVLNGGVSVSGTAKGITVNADTTGGNAGIKNEFIGLPRIKNVGISTMANGTTNTHIVDIGDSETPATDWTAIDADVVVADDAVRYRQGTASLQLAIATTAAATDGITNTLASGNQDWTDEDSFGFWAYTDSAIAGSELELVITDSVAGATAVNIGAITATVWQWVEVDISGVAAASKDVITDLAIRLTATGETHAAGGAFQVNLDFIVAWDVAEEETLGVEILQDGVMSVTVIDATDGAATSANIVEYTDYFVHYQTGNDAVVMVSDQSGTDKVGLVLVAY